MECERIRKRLEQLGHIIIINLPFENVEPIFMEIDFKNRTTLEVIDQYDIIPFAVKHKLQQLIDKIWSGKNSNQVDGKVSHFSKTQYLLYYNARCLPGAEISIKDIAITSFVPNIDDFNFSF